MFMWMEIPPGCTKDEESDATVNDYVASLKEAGAIILGCRAMKMFDLRKGEDLRRIDVFVIDPSKMMHQLVSDFGPNGFADPSEMVALYKNLDPKQGMAVEIRWD